MCVPVRLVLSGGWIWTGESFSVLGTRRDEILEPGETLERTIMGIWHCSGTSVGGHGGCWDSCEPLWPAGMLLVDWSQ